MIAKNSENTFGCQLYTGIPTLGAGQIKTDHGREDHHVMLAVGKRLYALLSSQGEYLESAGRFLVGGIASG